MKFHYKWGLDDTIFLNKCKCHLMMIIQMHTNDILNIGEDSFQMCMWTFNLLTLT